MTKLSPRIRFDKAAYRAAKDRANQLIKDSHPEWETNQGFIADGIVCPDVYEMQPFRILCLRGESYGYDECGMTDIEDQPNDDIIGVGSPKRWTAKRLPALLWLLQTSAESRRKIPWEDFPDLCSITTQHTQMLQTALAKAAWVNVKKESRHIDEFGGEATRMDYSEAYAHALRNKEILRIQIEAIAPTLIIVCGQVVFNALHEADLLGNQAVHGKKGVLQAFNDSAKIIELSHPGYHRDWGYEGIYETFESIYTQLSPDTCTFHEGALPHDV